MRQLWKRYALVSRAVQPLRLLLLLSLAMLGVNGHFACDADGWEVETPSEAYTWAYQPPQGCTCKATDVSMAECTVTTS